MTDIKLWTRGVGFSAGDQQFAVRSKRWRILAHGRACRNVEGRMIGLTIGVLAFLTVFAVVALTRSLARSPVVGGIAGMIIGFLVGVVADEAIGVMHWFGPVDIPNPVIQIGDVATTLGTLYPVIFDLAGLIVGVVAATIRKWK
jgi:hypothetical protein